MKTVVLKSDQELIVPVLSNHGIPSLVAPGQAVEVPDDVAESLLAQSDVWGSNDENKED